MNDFSPSDLKTILHSKRANLYSLEHCCKLVSAPWLAASRQTTRELAFFGFERFLLSPNAFGSSKKRPPCGGLVKVLSEKSFSVKR